MKGGYEPIAEVLFNELNVDTYLLEVGPSSSEMILLPMHQEYSSTMNAP